MTNPGFSFRLGRNLTRSGRGQTGNPESSLGLEQDRGEGWKLGEVRMSGTQGPAYLGWDRHRLEIHEAGVKRVEVGGGKGGDSGVNGEIGDRRKTGKTGSEIEAEG